MHIIRLYSNFFDCCGGYVINKSLNMNNKQLFEYALVVAKEHSNECGYPVVETENKFEIFGLHYVLIVDWDIPLLTIKEYDTDYDESSGEVVLDVVKRKLRCVAFLII